MRSLPNSDRFSRSAFFKSQPLFKNEEAGNSEDQDYCYAKETRKEPRESTGGSRIPPLGISSSSPSCYLDLPATSQSSSPALMPRQAGQSTMAGWKHQWKSWRKAPGCFSNTSKFENHFFTSSLICLLVSPQSLIKPQRSPVIISVVCVFFL